MQPCMYKTGVVKSSALSKREGAGHLAERNYTSQSTLLAESRAGDEYLDELVSVMMTPKGSSRLHIPEVRIINAQVLNMFLQRLGKCALFSMNVSTYLCCVDA